MRTPGKPAKKHLTAPQSGHISNQKGSHIHLSQLKHDKESNTKLITIHTITSFFAVQRF